MTILNRRRAVPLGLAALLTMHGMILTTVPARATLVGDATAGTVGPGDDRAPHLYAERLPGTLGCVDDAYSRVTWGCD